MKRLFGAVIPRIIADLEKRRIRIVAVNARGRLLDVGCGENRLVREYGNGTGVDVHDWGDVDVVVPSSGDLPFPDRSYDTVSFLACLNHIPNRDEALREARRVLRDDGILLATMIPPVISAIWHHIVEPWDHDQSHRGMQEGEVWGFTSSQMRELFERAGFQLVSKRGFIFGLNTLYIARKSSSP